MKSVSSGDFFLGGGFMKFFEVIHLLTQEIQIVSEMIRDDVGDPSKTNLAIFDVTAAAKSNTYTREFEEFAPKKVNLKLFTWKIRLYEPIQIQ